MARHMQTTHAVLAFLQHLNGFGGLALAVPQPNCSIKTAYPSTYQLPSLV